MKKRWQLEDLDPSNCMVISAVLDPRFKSVKFIDEVKMEDVKTELIDRIQNLPDLVVENLPPQKKSKSALDILLGEEEGTSVSDSPGFPLLESSSCGFI